jgi:hypothetical protein
MQTHFESNTIPLFATAVCASAVVAALWTAEPARTAPDDIAAVKESEVSTAVPLDEVAQPERTLARATVQTSKGERIGEVRAVVIGSNGAPTAVNVTTTGLLGLGTLTKSIKADDLVYVRDRKVLVSRLTKAEINALPAQAKKRGA